MGDGSGAILVLGLIAVVGVVIWKRCDIFPTMSGCPKDPVKLAAITERNKAVYFDKRVAAQKSRTDNSTPSATPSTKSKCSGIGYHYVGGLGLVDSTSCKASSTAATAHYSRSRFTRISI